MTSLLKAPEKTFYQIPNSTLENLILMSMLTKPKMCDLYLDTDTVMGSFLAESKALGVSLFSVLCLVQMVLGHLCFIYGA